MGIKDKTFSEIEEKYELEIERIVKAIRKEGADSAKAENCLRILLQFPEGMKPYSQAICCEIERRTGCQWI